MKIPFAECAIEALGLGAFMLSACGFATLLEHPVSPVRQAIDDAFVRRVLMGAAMGITAIALIHSPWGKRSGAHFNPSVTLAFHRLGRVPRAIGLAYALSQTLGAVLGVLLARAVMGAAVGHPTVGFVATVPGPHGAAVAFAAELAISFAMMLTVLTVSASRYEPWTGRVAGALVALWIIVEAPLSGMSMNPARTLGSALVARNFTSLWIYLVAPPLGMMLAAEVHARTRARGCAKLVHAMPCLFCQRG
jgi:aquaporin Z